MLKPFLRRPSEALMWTFFGVFGVCLLVFSQIEDEYYKTLTASIGGIFLGAGAMVSTRLSLAEGKIKLKRARIYRDKTPRLFMAAVFLSFFAEALLTLFGFAGLYKAFFGGWPW